MPETLDTLAQRMTLFFNLQQAQVNSLQNNVLAEVARARDLNANHVSASLLALYTRLQAEIVSNREQVINNLVLAQTNIMSSVSGVTNQLQLKIDASDRLITEQIVKNTFFLNGELVKAKTDIQNLVREEANRVNNNITNNIITAQAQLKANLAELELNVLNNIRAYSVTSEQIKEKLSSVIYDAARNSENAIVTAIANGIEINLPIFDIVLDFLDTLFPGIRDTLRG